MAAFSTTMDRLAEGQRGYVTGIGADCAMRTRLQDLGLVEGAAVRCVFRSPAGSPAAYEIRGAVIALRSGDASEVQVVAG